MTQEDKIALSKRIMEAVSFAIGPLTGDAKGKVAGFQIAIVSNVGDDQYHTGVMVYAASELVQEILDEPTLFEFDADNPSFMADLKQGRD